jgi:hypothetical protein
VQRARTCAFGGLETANRAERRRPQDEVRYAVIRVIKEVRGRRPHTKSRTLFQFEAAVKRKVYGFRAGSDDIAYWIIAEPADLVLGRDECGGIDPLMDILIRRSYRNSTYYIRPRCPVELS